MRFKEESEDNSHSLPLINHMLLQRMLTVIDLKQKPFVRGRGRGGSV